MAVSLEKMKMHLNPEAAAVLAGGTNLSNRKLRIAVWHNLPSGGAKRALWHYVSGLVQRGHHVEAWCPPTADRSYQSLEDICPEHVVPLTVYGSATAPKFIRWVANNVIVRRQIRAMREHSRACAKQIQAQGFDVLLANACSSFAAPAIGRFMDIPAALYLGEPLRRLYEVLPNVIWPAPAPRSKSQTVCSWPRLLANTLKLSAQRIQMREELDNARHFDRILVNSAFSRESVLRAYGLDSFVCRLGIDTEQFRPTGQPVEKYIMGLGAVHYHKGVDRAIEALGLVPTAVRPKLLWVGNVADAAYMADLQQRAKHLGVDFETRVMVKDDELISLLSRAAALLYTSRLEPFGLAPLEANACGTPVIAIAEGGVRETIVPGENGVLVPDARPQSIASAIQYYFENPAQAAALRAKCRSAVVSRWGMAASVEGLEKSLRDVIQTATQSARLNHTDHTPDSKPNPILAFRHS